MKEHAGNMRVELNSLNVDMSHGLGLATQRGPVLKTEDNYLLSLSVRT